MWAYTVSEVLRKAKTNKLSMQFEPTNLISKKQNCVLRCTHSWKEDRQLKDFTENTKHFIIHFVLRQGL